MIMIEPNASRLVRHGIPSYDPVRPGRVRTTAIKLSVWPSGLSVVLISEDGIGIAVGDVEI